MNCLDLKGKFKLLIGFCNFTIVYWCRGCFLLRVFLDEIYLIFLKIEMALKGFQSVIWILYWLQGISHLPRKCLDWMTYNILQEGRKGSISETGLVLISVGAVCNSSLNLLFIRLLNNLWCRTFWIWIIKFPQKCKRCLLVYFWRSFVEMGLPTCQNLV